MMEHLGDDMLAVIFSNIKDSNDRETLFQVCKQWSRVKGSQISALRVYGVHRLQSFLPRFPNLIKFQASAAMSNALMQFIADTCPRIQVLMLPNYEQIFRHCDFDDEGLSAISKGCRDLRSITLRDRLGIGCLGIASLVEFSRNLTSLDLTRCAKVADDALESIGTMSTLETLKLEGCFMITDVGLAFLTKGSVCKTLKRLNLAECDRITDCGLIHLKNISSLKDLSLANCGLAITNIGGVTGLAEIKSLVSLDLSWLDNLSNETMVALAKNCRKLEVLHFTDCKLLAAESISAIRAFTGHESLKRIHYNTLKSSTHGYKLGHLIAGRMRNSSELIVLAHRLDKFPISVHENILKRQCLLDWM